MLQLLKTLRFCVLFQGLIWLPFSRAAGVFTASGNRNLKGNHQVDLSLTTSPETGAISWTENSCGKIASRHPSFGTTKNQQVIVTRVTAKVSVQSMHPGKACLMLKSETWHENSRSRLLKWLKIVEVVSVRSYYTV